MTRRWSRNFDACTVCGSTYCKHKAHGICSTCYDKARYDAKPKNPKKAKKWSASYEHCTECGKTDSRHYRQGKCRRCCLRELKREQSLLRNEASKKAIAEAERIAALEFRLKVGDLIRKKGLEMMQCPLFMVVRCYRANESERCVGVDIRDGETVREFRMDECQRYGHFKVGA